MELKPNRLFPYLLYVDGAPTKLYSSYDNLMRKAEDLMEGGYQCSIEIFGEELMEDL